MLKVFFKLCFYNYFVGKNYLMYLNVIKIVFLGRNYFVDCFLKYKDFGRVYINNLVYLVEE